MSAKEHNGSKEARHGIMIRLTLGEAHAAFVRFASPDAALAAFGEALRAIGAEIAASPESQTGRSHSSSPRPLAHASSPRAEHPACAASFPGAAGLRSPRRKRRIW
jgi:hypothetical protein